MGKLYARKIIATTDGSYTLKEVPKFWQTKTIAGFAELLEAGEITQEEHDAYIGVIE